MFFVVATRGVAKGDIMGSPAPCEAMLEQVYDQLAGSDHRNENLDRI